jgi:hypothetical protein
MGTTLFLFTYCSTEETTNSKNTPEDDANILGKKFCECLGTFSEETLPFYFNAQLDSCNQLIAKDLADFQQKYKSQDAELTAFLNAYEKAVEEKMAEFSNIQSAVYAAYEFDIRQKLMKGPWFRSTDKKGYYLYSFSENQFNILNCKGSFEYSLSLDTLIFNDDNETKCLVDLTLDDKLILRNLDGVNAYEYIASSDKDKLLGSWTVEGGITVAFYAGGLCNVTQGRTSKSGKYSFNQNRLEVDGPPSYPVYWSSLDAFRWGEAKFFRNKLTMPKTLDFLTEK